MWRSLRWRGVKKKEIEKASYIWKLPPEDNGGLLARSFEQLLEQLDTAFEDPACCADRSREFLHRHMLDADGQSCQRIWEAMVELAR
jgi:hypothetical protein